MLPFLDPFRGLSFLSITLRMVLSVLCGSVIGIEREFKRRPAGFRTHILICMGAAVTTLTSQYLMVQMHYYTDIARMGAQVIAGIGFIGAGTIVVTRHQRVKGLTTAAGLWSVAIVGLAIGSGFYEGAVAATALIFAAESFFSKLEYWIIRNAPEVNLMLEYTDNASLAALLQQFREKNVKLLHLEITQGARGNSCAIFSLRLHKKFKVRQLLELIAEIPGIASVEEL